MTPHSTEARGAVRINLPWPAKALSPNARVHWAVKAASVKKARSDAYVLTRSSMVEIPRWLGVHVTLDFCPPSRRRYDADNIIASLKASMDGIADALGIDDSKFIPTYRFGDPVKGGEVRVTLEPME